MIIKSMSRKEPSFRQLMDYISREMGTEAFKFRHNLMGRGDDVVGAEFEQNASLLKRRKNGVFLYHEILSITRAQGLPEKAQQELLYGIAQQYVDARCPDNLVYGGLHQDKDHSYHMHLMISANRAGDSARLRLTKAQFREIQVQLEAHVLENHPELEQKLAINKQAERKRTRGDVEHERRTGRPPSRKEALRGRLHAAYEQSDSREAFAAALQEQGFRHEARGKTFARVIDEYTGQAHRVATLDAELASRFEALMTLAQSEPEREDAAERQGAEQEAQTGPERDTARDQDRATASGGAGEKENEGPKVSREEARAEADRQRHAEERQAGAQQRADKEEPEIEERATKPKRRRSSERSRQRPEREREKRAERPDRERNTGDQPQPDAEPVRSEPEGEVTKGKGGYSPFGFGRKIAGVAHKALNRGMEETRIVGQLLRESLLREDMQGPNPAGSEQAPEAEPAPQEPDPSPQAEPRQQKRETEPEPEREIPGQSEQQARWRRESQRRRERGRDGPERGR